MITTKDVEKIARLARLALPPADLEKYTQQLNNILGFMEKLDQLDTSAIEATAHAVEVATPLREDEAVTTTIAQDIFKIAPDSEDGFFKVPKVL